MIKENELAPDFALLADDGEEFTLSSVKGKKVVLYFYPKDNTPGCTKEACSLRDGHDEILAKGAVVVGVSPDTIESHQKFRLGFALPFYLLSDPDHRVSEMYGAWGQKNLYGKISTGILRSTVIIDEEGKIIKIIRKVNTADHATQVLPYL